MYSWLGTTSDLGPANVDLLHTCKIYEISACIHERKRKK